MNDELFGPDPTTPDTPTIQAWPPDWTLKPVTGQPDTNNTHYPEEIEWVGWDISLGFRLNIRHADEDDITSPLTIGAHFGDVDHARGFVKREATPAQLREFARLLLNIAAAHEQRTNDGRRKED